MTCLTIPTRLSVPTGPAIVCSILVWMYKILLPWSACVATAIAHSTRSECLASPRRCRAGPEHTRYLTSHDALHLTHASAQATRRHVWPPCAPLHPRRHARAEQRTAHTVPHTYHMTRTHRATHSAALVYLRLDQILPAPVPPMVPSWSRSTPVTHSSELIIFSRALPLLNQGRLPWGRCLRWMCPYGVSRRRRHAGGHAERQHAARSHLLLGGVQLSSSRIGDGVGRVGIHLCEETVACCGYVVGSC